ncbi:MAG: glycosyltransferase family 4 protein [Prolixibacteraceae bacterium]|nr:glycosyltransferase family 4 protein [Prolixibacteraceae bacterium]
MKILFVTDYYYPHIGGVEKLFKSLAESLVEKGNKVSVITWRYERELRKREIINGVEIIRINSISRALFSISGLPEIISSANKSELIHTSTYSSALGAYIASRLTKTKIIITVHEVWGKLWLSLPHTSILSGYMYKLLEKFILKLKFNKYISVSENTNKELIKLGISKNKIKVIYNGIDYNLPKWKGITEPFTFTFFGRAGLSKGLDIMIKASELIHKEYPYLKFKFIISPQIKSLYKKYILEIKSGSIKDSSVIKTNLPFNELTEELITSSCIIVPSYSEGFGFTAVESSAMGIPLISSGKGSLKEVVFGKVITMKDLRPESLKESMIKAVNNDFETVQNKQFTIQDFINNHLELYDELKD